jgi:hypothetical protein
VNKTPSSLIGVVEFTGCFDACVHAPSGVGEAKAKAAAEEDEDEDDEDERVKEKEKENQTRRKYSHW